MAGALAAVGLHLREHAVGAPSPSVSNGSSSYGEAFTQGCDGGLKSGDDEPPLSPSPVDQLLGREARPGAKVGEVTSGGPAPTLEKNIGMGYVPLALSAPGTTLKIDCRGKMVAAQIVKGPFYQRGK